MQQGRIIAVVLTIAAFMLSLEAVASSFYVKVNRGRLSVSAENAHFGSLMDKIAKDAGFEVLISPDIASKTLSTDFQDLGLEMGIQRLMGLIRHRNFFMFYGRDGNIKKIEIYGARGSSSLRASRPSSSPGKHGRGVAPLIMDTPGGSGSKSSSRGRHNDIKDVPYIPPVTIPEFIPPRRGILGSK